MVSIEASNYKFICFTDKGRQLMLRLREGLRTDMDIEIEIGMEGLSADRERQEASFPPACFPALCKKSVPIFYLWVPTKPSRRGGSSDTKPV